jgi:hypothetical protein
MTQWELDQWWKCTNGFVTLVSQWQMSTILCVLQRAVKKQVTWSTWSNTILPHTKVYSFSLYCILLQFVARFMPIAFDIMLEALLYRATVGKGSKNNILLFKFRVALNIWQSLTERVSKRATRIEYSLYSCFKTLSCWRLVEVSFKSMLQKTKQFGRCIGHWRNVSRVSWCGSSVLTNRVTNEPSQISYN